MRQFVGPVFDLGWWGCYEHSSWSYEHTGECCGGFAGDPDVHRDRRVAHRGQSGRPSWCGCRGKGDQRAGGVLTDTGKVVFSNPEADPNKAVACARQAATDKAIAVVGMTDTLDNVILPVLQQEGIPDVGATVGGNPIDVQSPDAYPFNAGTAGAYMASDYALAQLGRKSVAVAVADVPSAVDDSHWVGLAAPKAGIRFAGDILIPLSGVTDYAPYVQKVKDSGADSLLFITTPAQSQGISLVSNPPG